jgi:hypothetical protein
MPNYYKFLNEDGSAIYGYGTWSLPNGDTPGDWMPFINEIEPCVSGYHLCRPGDLIRWVGPRLFVAEPKGDIIETDNKIVCHQARLVKEVTTWNKATARLFACHCAERALPFFEKLHPNDNRPKNAIETAMAFVNGQVSRDDLAAAGAAAWAATGDAAGAAAGTAAWAAARAAARAAAWAAAWAATGNAAGAAAGAAARAAAGAARDARAAAWAAAGAARDARDAAWWAARDAGDAEHEWQTKLLLDMLKGDQYA